MMMETDDDASRAYASISAQLETWTSPRLGNTYALSTYEEDTDEWLQQTLAKDLPTEDDGRGTPIMSNNSRDSAKKQMLSSPEGVVSPWIERVTNPSQSTSSMDSNHRTYHDAMWWHIQANRNIAQRMQMARDEATLRGQSVADLTALGKEDERADLDLLSSLAIDTPLFSLLATLRTLGVHVMLWDDSSKHQVQVRQSMSYLATQTSLTPAQLIFQLHSASSAPLILQRRKAILKWLQAWHSQAMEQLVLPRKTIAMWPQSLEHLQQKSTSNDKVNTLHPDAPLLIQDTATEPLYGTDNAQDKLLLKACLVFILAGRMDLAQDLCRKQGQPWRCAIWNGGIPHDITVVPNDNTQVMMTKQIGNPARFLWKRQVAKLVKAVNSQEEAAICSLLCNDMGSALVNPLLRTWQAGLYTCFTALQGRLEDELLHLAGKGKEYETFTLQQLNATSNVASLDEPRILETLAASPFEDMRTSTPMQGAMASVLVGKQAVIRYCQSETNIDDDKANLRRLLHFVIYLDSLQRSTSPVILEGMHLIKNQLLQEYLLHLSQQPSLWRFMALYASLLPTNTMLSVVPNLLTKVELELERKTIATQLNDLLPGLDITILKSTVMLILAGTGSEAIKCNAIMWLTHFREHMAEALVCANATLRLFIIRNKLATATNFIRLHLPDTVIANDSSGNENAYREFQALRCYLEAIEAFEQWKQVMIDTVPETKAKKLSRHSLSASEVDIAASMERRLFIEKKQDISRMVVVTALAAHQRLMEVLGFEGGWLLEDNDDDDNDDDAMEQENEVEETSRQNELEKLRLQCVPEVVFMLHNVCDETATWMESSLEDGAIRLERSTQEVLKALDDCEGVFDPLYWIRRAKGFITIVASDENDIMNAIGTQEMKHLNKLIQETVIRELDYE